MIALYADDTAAVAHRDNCKSEIRSTVHRISSWAKDWKIFLNESKLIRVGFSLGPHPSLPIYPGDSMNKAKIESIFLLKLKVIFSEIFFMEFVVGIYLKACTWLCPQKTSPRGKGEQFVHYDGH